MSETTISVSIDVPSLADGIAFYGQAFGFEVSVRPAPGVAVLKLGGASLCLLEKKEGSKPLPQTADTRRHERHWTPVHLDIHLADLDAALVRAIAAGAKIKVFLNSLAVGTHSLVGGKHIKSVKDLKGKRVSTGSPGSATEVMAFRLIEAAGLDKDKDLKRERLGVAESVNAIKDGKIDAFFWVGGLPTAAVTDLANTPGVKIKMIDHADAVANMNRKYGNLYVEDTIPKDMYKGMEHDNKQATVMNILVVHENMDDKTAYSIVKTMFDKRDDLIAAHKEATNLRLDGQKQAATPIPFHPGAARFYAEKGIKLN